MPNHKIERISSDIHRYISDVLANEANDELLKTITITDAVVSKDLSYCKVYFTSLSDLPKERLEKELNEASLYIRGKISEKLEIRHTPILKFIYDSSISYGQNIENIIKNLNS